MLSYWWRAIVSIAQLPSPSVAVAHKLHENKVQAKRNPVDSRKEHNLKGRNKMGPFCTGTVELPRDSTIFCAKASPQGTCFINCSEYRPSPPHLVSVSTGTSGSWFVVVALDTGKGDKWLSRYPSSSRLSCCVRKGLNVLNSSWRDRRGSNDRRLCE